MNNTAVFLKGFATVAQSVIRSLKDGKLDLTDLGNFFDDLGDVQNAIEAAGFLPNELKALVIDDIDGIIDIALEELEADLSDEQLYTIEAILRFVLVMITLANNK
jgi:hypothetical protein